MMCSWLYSGWDESQGETTGIFGNRASGWSGDICSYVGIVPVVVTWELSWKAKLSIYQSVCAKAKPMVISSGY